MADSYEFDVDQTFDGVVDKELPDGYRRQNRQGETVVVARVVVAADTLQEAFSLAVDQFLDEMTAASWTSVPVLNGIGARVVVGRAVA